MTIETNNAVSLFLDDSALEGLVEGKRGRESTGPSIPSWFADSVKRIETKGHVLLAADVWKKRGSLFSQYVRGSKDGKIQAAKPGYRVSASVRLDEATKKPHLYVVKIVKIENDNSGV